MSRAIVGDKLIVTKAFAYANRITFQPGDHFVVDQVIGDPVAKIGVRPTWTQADGLECPSVVVEIPVGAFPSYLGPRLELERQAPPVRRLRNGKGRKVGKREAVQICLRSLIAHLGTLDPEHLFAGEDCQRNEDVFQAARQDIADRLRRMVRDE